MAQSGGEHGDGIFRAHDGGIELTCTRAVDDDVVSVICHSSRVYASDPGSIHGGVDALAKPLSRGDKHSIRRTFLLNIC